MNRLMRHGGCGLLLFFCWLLPAAGQTAADRISAIIVTNIGPEAASADLVRANIHVKVGDVYNPNSVRDDIPNLYGTRLFRNILISDRQTPQGWELTYRLQGKPRITSITFAGNTKFSNSKLLKKVASRTGAPLDEMTLLNDTQEIVKTYEKAGYTHTKVTYEEINLDQAAGLAGVLYQITEAPKIKITDVQFQGASAFTQRQLRGVLKTRRHWMFSWITQSGVFKEDEFEDDQDRLADYYRNAGYIDFEIKATNITYPTPRQMLIRFALSEGRQYRVGSVTFKGNELFTAQQISATLKAVHDNNRSKAVIGEHGLEADVGLIFKPEALNHDLEAIGDFYGAKGYIDVARSLRVTQIPNTETGTMDLEYQIDEGQKIVIEKIEINGNVKTKDKVIRRELFVSPGETFNMVAVKNSQRRLEQMEYFVPGSVKVDAEADLTLPTNARNLIISVDEQSTGNVSFGASYSTQDSITGFVSVEEKNFDLGKPPYFVGRGGGQKVLIKLTAGTLIQDYRLNFTEPWFLGRHLILDVGLYRSVADNLSLDNLYDVAKTGARVSLTRALGREFIKGTVSYNIEEIEINHINTNAPDLILNDAGKRLVNRFGAGIAVDNTRDVELPNSGTRTSLSSILTVGGNRNYVKTDLESAWYFKGLFKGHVLEVLGHVGVAQKLGSQDVPFYDRYYSGGQDTLRGFDYTGVGPRAVTQDGGSYEPIGGDTFWLGSLEYSLPIIERLRFAVFYDIGNVSARPFSNEGYPVLGKQNQGGIGPPVGFIQTYPGNTGTFSDNYGVGLRLDIPYLRGLRLDYGIPLHHDPFNSGSGKFNFGIGYSRPL